MRIATAARMLALASLASGLLMGVARAEMSLGQALAVEPYPAPPATPSQVLLRNATVWTQTTEGILEGTDVLIENGRIKALGRGLKATPGALVVDATGRHVTPGIIDAHSHSATETLDLNEGVNSISAEVRVSDVLNPHSRDIYLQLAGGVTTAHVLHGSANAIGGQNALIKYRWGVASAAELLFAGAPPTIKFALGENPKRANAGATPTPRYPATRMGVMDVIRQAFTEARAYQQAWEAHRRRVAAGDTAALAPRRDLALEPLVEILEGRRHVHAHCYRADEILQLIRLAEEFGFRIGTFQHVLEGYKVADEIARHGAGASTFSDWWAYKVEAYDAIPYNAALMAERGVLVSINSDSAEEMRHLNQEAAKAMKYGGLSEDETLKLVTINPARQLHVADRVGSIEVGKDADLVLFDKHPLSVYAVAQKVFIDGRLYFDRRTDLEARPGLEREKQTLTEKLAPRRGTTPPDGREPSGETRPQATPGEGGWQ